MKVMYRSFDSFVSTFQTTIDSIETNYNMSDIYVKANSELDKIVLLQTLYLHLEALVDSCCNTNTDVLQMNIWNDSIITQLCNQLNIKKSRILQFLNISSHNLVI